MHTSATNFAVLRTHDEQLMRLGLLAEGYFADDPNTSLLKLRQLTELLAQHVATRVGLFTSWEEPQYELIRRLQDQGILPREVAQLLARVGAPVRVRANPRCRRRKRKLSGTRTRSRNGLFVNLDSLQSLLSER